MLALSPSSSAITFGITKSLLASGGVAPYAYSVLPGGAGGLIDQNGYYGAPPYPNENPSKTFDTIQVEDSNGDTATAIVLVCNVGQLLCNIISTEMGLDSSRVYLWDQKIKEPTDFALWIVVGELACKPFGNNRRQEQSDDGFESFQYTNFMTTFSIDIFSRGPAARDRKEEVIMSLMSYYAESQQEANSFKIAKLPIGFVNLSQVDGAAIPYRFNLSFNVSYVVKKTKSVPYFDQFVSPEILIDP